jgi:undecaprenyl-diphosphatase
MFWYALILGAVQGLTEFLPISSSGHLALGRLLFRDFSPPGILFEILVHFATALAVVIFLKYEIWSMIKSLFTFGGKSQSEKTEGDRRLLLMIIIASVPTAIIALLLRDAAEKAFITPWMIAVAYLVTATMLILSIRFKRSVKNLSQISVTDVLLIGAIQGIAIFPGVSRSGATIVLALCLGLAPLAAARFSFLIALPAIFGAMLYDLKTLLMQTALNSDVILPFIVGMLMAGILGYLALIFVVRITKRWKLHYFAPYCFVLSAMVLFFS